MSLLVQANRVQETTVSTGTGTIGLGGAVAQCQSFISAIGDGNSCDYVLLSGNGTDWETGVTVVHAGTPVTLSRDSIYSSTNAGAAINLTGTSSVFLAPTAARTYGRLGRRPTRPAGSSFTWVNQGSASYTDYTNGPLTMSVAASATDSLKCLVQPVPGSTPWTATCEFEALQWNFSFSMAGLCVIDNANKLIEFGYQVGLVTANNSQAVINYYNSPTSFNINKFGTAYNPIGYYWFRIVNDGVNFTFYISHNGADWVQIFQASVTAFLGSTLSSVGIFCNVGSASPPTNTLASFWAFDLGTGTGNNVQWV